jgi:hypothetical protein
MEIIVERKVWKIMYQSDMIIIVFYIKIDSRYFAILIEISTTILKGLYIALLYKYNG